MGVAELGVDDEQVGGQPAELGTGEEVEYHYQRAGLARPANAAVADEGRAGGERDGAGVGHSRAGSAEDRLLASSPLPAELQPLSSLGRDAGRTGVGSRSPSPSPLRGAMGEEMEMGIREPVMRSEIEPTRPVVTEEVCWLDRSNEHCGMGRRRGGDQWWRFWDKGIKSDFGFRGESGMPREGEAERGWLVAK